ncbi:MAG: universal stress protein [Nitrospirae bacterium]|nr:universal stress protein [Nitrospirota bacterium]
MSCAETCPIVSEKILLAMDGSSYSEGAIREAIGFAKRCSSSLYIVSTLETNPEYETIGSNVFEKEEAEVMAYLESIKAMAANEGLKCETILRKSTDSSQAIVEEAIEKKVDIIVIGRRGRKGIVKLLMGEVSAKVIGHAPCNVLVVPRAAVISYRNILVATDGSGHSIAAAEQAIRIAKRCGSSVTALSSIRSNDELGAAKSNINKVVEMAQKENVPAEGITPMGRSYNVIVETAGGRGVDLIVMGISAKTALQKIFTGSAAEQVIGNAGCAVLIVKGGESPATV